MQTGPGPLVIEDPPPGMSCLLMVISSHGEVRSSLYYYIFLKGLPVRLRRLSAVSWVMLRVNCYGSDHFYANYACLKVVLCPSTVTTKLPHKSQTILSSQLFWRVAFDSFPPFLSWRKGFLASSVLHIGKESLPSSSPQLRNLLNPYLLYQLLVLDSGISFLSRPKTFAQRASSPQRPFLCSRQLHLSWNSLCKSFRSSFICFC